MAKASVELVCAGCGKTFRHEKICRNRESANAYETWARDNVSLCPKCYSECMKQDELRKCAEKVGNRELTPLSGTEKQIAWANEIRTQMVALLVGKSKNVSDEMWAAINSFAEAGFWIDHRFKYGDVRHTIIDNLVRRHKFAPLSGDSSCIEAANSARRECVAAIIERHGGITDYGWSVIDRIEDAQFWADHKGNIQAVEDAMNQIFIPDKTSRQ